MRLIGVSQGLSFHHLSPYIKRHLSTLKPSFELWEVTRYKNGSLAMNHISTESDVDINTTLVDDDKSNVVKQVSKEVIRYDEDYHLYKSKNRPQSVVELYHNLKERVMGMAEG